MKYIFCLLLLICNNAFAADSLYGGFSNASPPGPTGRGTVWNVVVNGAALTVDPASLDFQIPGSPTANYVRRSSRRTGPTSLTWVGVNGRDEAIIHAEEGIVSGLIFAGSEHFEIEAIGSGSRFEWVDQSKVGEPSLPLPPTQTSQVLPITFPVQTTRAATSGPAQVDVLFLYTPQAVAGVGGGFFLNNLLSQIRGAVAATNNAYVGSSANVQMNVAGIEAVPSGIIDTCIPPAAICASPNYGEAISQDLQTLTDNAAVTARRNALRADIVVMIIENGGTAAPPDTNIKLCGVARQMRAAEINSFESLAFSVVRRDCATGNLTLAHEAGHNMGLEHHPFETGSIPTPTFPWSFAHSIGGTTAGFHSIMSTNYECVSQGLLCSLIPRFSNPDNTWSVNNGGVITQTPTGVVDLRDNARTLRSTGPIAEGWRAGYFANGFESP